jgi:hypothetical protein
VTGGGGAQREKHLEVKEKMKKCVPVPQQFVYNF